MNDNGKGSARRGTSKEEMKKFEDNYDAIFRKPRKKAVAEKIEIEDIPPELMQITEELTAALRKRLKDSE